MLRFLHSYYWIAVKNVKWCWSESGALLDTEWNALYFRTLDKYYHSHLVAVVGGFGVAGNYV